MKKPVSMIVRTKKLMDINDCQEGQVVAEDIVTSQGMLLLPKSTVLNTYILNRLQNHQVYQLYVYTTDDKKNMR